jgi:N-acetylmuramoyl-L-alanine amidase
MRTIDTIIVHCSATPASMDIGAREIRQWHRSTPFNFKDIGYHYVIRRDGAVEVGRPLAMPGAHAAGHNHSSIGLCLVGGVDANSRTKGEFNYTHWQMDALWWEISAIIAEFDIKRLIGHRDVDPGKACPCFNVGEWWGW